MKNSSFWKGLFVGLLITLLVVTGIFGVVVGKNFELVLNMVRVVEKLQTEALQEVNTTQLLQGSIEGMVGSLDDPYSVYLPPKEAKDLGEHISGSYGGVGLLISKEEDRLVVVSPFRGTPAFKAGIKSRDVILEVDGEDTSELTLEEAADKMKGHPDTEVVLSIWREGLTVPKDYTITREVIDIPSVRGEHLKAYPEIAYISISMFNEHTGRELGEEIMRLRSEAKMKGIILDLRNNPGGFLPAAIEVASYFIPEGPVVYTVGKGVTQPLMSTGKPLGLPLVVLVNNGSASASEIVSGAIKDTESGTIIGETTFGKGLVQTVFQLGKGAAVKLTTHKYLTPDKHDINKKGIVPDIEVKMDPEEEMKALIEAPDLQNDIRLQKAVDVLLKN